MNKKIYVGVDNKAKQVKTFYVGINNTARKIKKAYVGVNNTARQIWPSVVYTWKRYTIATINTYYWNKYNDVQSTSTEYDVAYGSGGILTDPSWTPKYLRGGPITNDRGYWYNAGKAEWYTGMSGWFANGLYGTAYNITDRYLDTSEKKNHYRCPYSQSAWITETTHTTHKKGSTSYGLVNSTNRNAYPDNSYQGGYWYVYSKSEQSKARGNLIDTITSDNSNTYPDNGISGNYWYVKQ